MTPHVPVGQNKLLRTPVEVAQSSTLAEPASFGGSRKSPKAFRDRGLECLVLLPCGQKPRRTERTFLSTKWWPTCRRVTVQVIHVQKAPNSHKAHALTQARVPGRFGQTKMAAAAAANRSRTS